MVGKSSVGLGRWGIPRWADTAKVPAMGEHAITLEVLPAGYGDRLLG